MKLEFEIKKCMMKINYSILGFFFQGHVFLDTMDPSEYYAQALNGHRPAPIKVNAPSLAPIYSRLIDAQIYRYFFFRANE